jgi:hypothetical protein
MRAATWEIAVRSSSPFAEIENTFIELHKQQGEILFSPLYRCKVYTGLFRAGLSDVNFCVLPPNSTRGPSEISARWGIFCACYFFWMGPILGIRLKLTVRYFLTG